jgi:hypothetical protein
MRAVYTSCKTSATAGMTAAGEIAVELSPGNKDSSSGLEIHTTSLVNFLLLFGCTLKKLDAFLKTNIFFIIFITQMTALIGR